MKLGKKAAKKDVRTLKLSNYFLASLPAPLPSLDWTMGITQWGMMKNDVLGNCTCAGIGHAEQSLTANTTGEIIATDDQVVDLYKATCGYDPGNPITDQGGVEIDVLNYVRKNGFLSDSLLAYADVDHNNLIHVKQAISLFGGVYIGVQLPVTAQNQQTWDVIGDPQSAPSSQPGSWGGHAVWVVKYTPETLTCVTWGGLKDMSTAFWLTYCDEVHALLFKSWLAEFNGEIDMAALENDLQVVTN